MYFGFLIHFLSPETGSSPALGRGGQSVPGGERPCSLGTSRLGRGRAESQGPVHACAVASVVSDSRQPMDCSPPGSSVHGTLQAPLSMGLSRLLCPWDSPGSSVHGALQAPLSMGLSRLLCPWDSPSKNAGWAAVPSSGALPDPGIQPAFLESPVLAGGTTGAAWEAPSGL